MIPRSFGEILGCALGQGEEESRDVRVYKITCLKLLYCLSKSKPSTKHSTLSTKFLFESSSCLSLKMSDSDPPGVSAHYTTNDRDHLSSLNISSSFIRELLKLEDPAVRQYRGEQMLQILENRREKVVESGKKRKLDQVTTDANAIQTAIPAAAADTSQEERPAKKPQLSAKPAIIGLLLPRVDTKTYVFDTIWVKIVALHTSQPDHPMFGACVDKKIR